jgi:hypothetical protein
MGYLAMLAAACIALPLLLLILGFIEHSFVWRDAIGDIITDRGEIPLLRLILIPVWLVMVVVCFMFALGAAVGLFNLARDANHWMDKK